MNKKKEEVGDETGVMGGLHGVWGKNEAIYGHSQESDSTTKAMIARGGGHFNRAASGP